MTKIDSFLYFLHAFLTFCTILALGLGVGFNLTSDPTLLHFIAIGVMLLLSKPKKSLS